MRKERPIDKYSLGELKRLMSSKNPYVYQDRAKIIDKRSVAMAEKGACYYIDKDAMGRKFHYIRMSRDKVIMFCSSLGLPVLGFFPGMYDEGYVDNITQELLFMATKKNEELYEVIEQSEYRFLMKIRDEYERDEGYSDKDVIGSLAIPRARRSNSYKFVISPWLIYASVQTNIANHFI